MYTNEKCYYEILISIYSVEAWAIYKAIALNGCKWTRQDTSAHKIKKHKKLT